MDTDSPQIRTLRRAADICGGKEALAQALGVPLGMLTRWLAGSEAPPVEAFIKALDMVANVRGPLGYTLDTPDKGCFLYSGDMPQAPRRILVVEDSLDAAESLVKVLKAIGHEAEYVTNPLDALDAARRLRPELVFLDIAMPRLDGYTLARMLRKEIRLR